MVELTHSVFDRFTAVHGIPNNPLGNRLEVTLFEGAEYYDGYTPAPTVNPRGFDPPKKPTEAPGERYIGYLHEIKEDKLTLCMGRDPKNVAIPEWRGNNHFYYFHRDAIHTIADLTEKTVFRYSK